MPTNTAYIGKPVSRVDGPKKVTGQATYAGEFRPENLAHGYIVNSSIANGTIISIDTERAKSVPGVLEVFTHKNLPESVRHNADYSDPLTPPGKPFRPLFNDNILYNGQPIALVVADTFETARYAAGLVTTTYNEGPCVIDLKENLHRATHDDVQAPPESRGNPELTYGSARYKVSVEYSQPRMYHNPMEPHASVADWDPKKETFTIYDKIQGIDTSQTYICGIFGLKKERVRILSPFVGGAFGSGLRPKYQLFFAALASKVLERPVKVAMTRRQMFSFGHRPACIQRLQLAADEKAKLVSIRHTAFSETSTFEKYSENVVGWSGLLYQCAHVALDYQLVPLNVYTPNDMRAPGGTTGIFALECAMDELAIEVGIDPLELRLRNYAERDQNENKPFSSKELRACYHEAADRFGWSKWQSTPRMQKKGNQLIGYGMATGCWEAMQQKAAAKAELGADGILTVSSGTADIGTGTYTIMSQIAAETLGVPLDHTDFILGDTSLPKAPIEGGSWTASSVGSAVKLVCQDLRKKLFELAQKANPDEFEGLTLEEVGFQDGKLVLAQGTSFPYSEIFQSTGTERLTAEVSSEPDKKREKFSCYTHSCIMVEVHVDEDLGTITVPRAVTAVAGGRIINPMTAKNQILGGITWGIGMALEEEGMMDNRNGRLINSNLAEYHVAVHADIQQLEVIFVKEEDDIVNPLGAKGLGEIGIVGVAAAIANAVYNATGKRVRNLPITLDKMLV